MSLIARICRQECGLTSHVAGVLRGLVSWSPVAHPPLRDAAAATRCAASDEAAPPPRASAAAATPLLPLAIPQQQQQQQQRQLSGLAASSSSTSSSTIQLCGIGWSSSSSSSSSAPAAAAWRHPAAAPCRHPTALPFPARGFASAAAAASAAPAGAADALPHPWEPPHSAAAGGDAAADGDSISFNAAATAPPAVTPIHHQTHQHQQHQQQPAAAVVQPPPPPAAAAAAAEDVALSVRAFHVGGALDFARFAADHARLIARSRVYRDHAVLELADIGGGAVLVGRRTAQQAGEAAALRVLAVYRYGSAVFFNSDPEAVEEWLERLRPYTRDPHQEPLEDETTVVVRPSLRPWFALEPDKLVLQALDMPNVRVLSGILAASVALEHYDRRVVAAIERFEPVLWAIAAGRGGGWNVSGGGSGGGSGSGARMLLPGVFAGLPRQLAGAGDDDLLKLIGETSLLHTDVVYKLGLLQPSDVAWRTDKYYDVWQAMHADHDIARRYEALKAKLGPLLTNAKFVLEVRSDRKSERSELVIIALIGVEIALHIAGWYM